MYRLAFYAEAPFWNACCRGLLAQTELGKEGVQQIISGHFSKDFLEMGSGIGEIDDKQIRFHACLLYTSDAADD